ncbi:MAG: hypothetical protein ACR9NN_10645 [Nostochopsis sp.]
MPLDDIFTTHDDFEDDDLGDDDNEHNDNLHDDLGDDDDLHDDDSEHHEEKLSSGTVNIAHPTSVLRSGFTGLFPCTICDCEGYEGIHGWGNKCTNCKHFWDVHC